MTIKRMTIGDAYGLVQLIARGITDDFGMDAGEAFRSSVTAIALCEDGDVTIAFDPEYAAPEGVDIDKRIELAQREQTIFPFNDPMRVLMLIKLERAWQTAKLNLRPNRFTGSTMFEMTSDEVTLFGGTHDRRTAKVKALIAEFENEGLLFNVHDTLDPSKRQDFCNTYAVNGQLIGNILGRAHAERRALVGNAETVQKTKWLESTEEYRKRMAALDPSTPKPQPDYAVPTGATFN
jgi:hypothetical protein